MCSARSRAGRRWFEARQPHESTHPGAGMRFETSGLDSRAPGAWTGRMTLVRRSSVQLTPASRLHERSFTPAPADGSVPARGSNPRQRCFRSNCRRPIGRRSRTAHDPSGSAQPPPNRGRQSPCVTPGPSDAPSILSCARGWLQCSSAEPGEYHRTLHPLGPSGLTVPTASS
jgi:hypothetical protein